MLVQRGREAAPASGAAAVQCRLLAQGLWLKTERCGDSVRRSAQPWCPRPLAVWLLKRLVEQYERVASYLPAPPLRLVLSGVEPHALQPYLEGATPLRRLSALQLADPTTIRSLCRFWQSVRRGWRALGWLPDVGGRVYLPWELYRPMHTENVVVAADGNCWLVDAAATATFHSARSPLGRLHASLMLRSIERCLIRLRCASEPQD